MAVLDAVRGLCALWVLAVHVSEMSGFYGHYTLLDRGDVAVDIFMFLSGFLMAYHYHLREEAEPWDCPKTWRRFYVRRFFRIVPLYYCALVIALVFHGEFASGLEHIIAAFPKPLAGWFHASPLMQAPDWPNVLSHFLFLFGFVPAYAASNILPDWSIGLEMQFYAAFPFIMLLCRRRGYLLATAFLLGIWYLSHQLFGVYADAPAKVFGTFPQPSFLPLKLSCFLIGILIAEAVYQRFSNPVRSMLLLLLAAAVALLTSQDVYFCVAVYACAAFTLIPGSPLEHTRVAAALNRLLQRRIFSFLAETSYGTYLFHMLILAPVASLLVEHSSFASWHATARFAFLLITMLALTYPVAFLAYRLVEQPGIRLGQRLLK
ncbi:MAG: acyltransferase [Opitutales bacterium]